jgi:hypothetical protein
MLDHRAGAITLAGTREAVAADAEITSVALQTKQQHKRSATRREL